MTKTDIPALDDPRVLALAQARQQISHEGVLNPTWDELTPAEQEGALPYARSYLYAAIRAGLIVDGETTWRHQEHCNPHITGTCACLPGDTAPLAETRAAAYREAAQLIEADGTCTTPAHTEHYAARLRARADEIETN